jgi:hypothetical protein
MKHISDRISFGRPLTLARTRRERGQKTLETRVPDGGESTNKQSGEGDNSTEKGVVDFVTCGREDGQTDG